MKGSSGALTVFVGRCRQAKGTRKEKIWRRLPTYSILIYLPKRRRKNKIFGDIYSEPKRRRKKWFLSYLSVLYIYCQNKWQFNSKLSCPVSKPSHLYVDCLLKDLPSFCQTPIRFGTRPLPTLCINEPFSQTSILREMSLAWHLRA